MNIPSKDIKEILDADSSVDTTTFPISRATWDESKSNTASIVDYSGASPQLTMDKAQYEFPTVQISVRCVDYDAGWAFLESVVQSLHGKANFVLNNTYYSLIECMNGPTFLIRENQRTVFVSNFRIQRREN